MTAGMRDQLQIRLQGPPWRNARLVGDFEHSLVIAYRAAGAGEANLVPVQTSGAVAYSAIACRDTQEVEFAAREETLISQAGVNLQAHQIAGGRGAADANKGGETLRRRVGAPPQHLVQHQIEAEIAAMGGRNAAAGGVRQRAPQGVTPQIEKISRMVPAAEFDIAQQKRRNRLRIECIGHFGNHQRTTLADQEIRAAGIANLRISRSGGRRIPVEGRSGTRQAGCRRGPHSHAWSREWIAWSPSRQVGRQKIRTAKRRVDKDCRVLTDVKFVVEGDLAEAE